MDTRALIEKVVASGLITKELTALSETGTTDVELKAVEKRIGRKLHPQLVAFLKIFNGANLDVIRFYPCKRLELREYGLVFADDPSGFVYYVTDSGEVVCEDTDGGSIKKLASSVTEFVHSYLFGNRSAEFMGEEWHEQLTKAGIAT